VKAADCSEHRKLLQNEIEISRWSAISPLQIGAAVTAGLNWLSGLAVLVAVSLVVATVMVASRR